MTTQIEANLKSATDLLVRSIMASKSKWMDSIMSQVLPADIYSWSKSGKNSDRMKLARWLAKNGYEIKEGEGFSQIWIGKELISTWAYRLVDGKVEQTIRPRKLWSFESSLQQSPKLVS